MSIKMSSVWQNLRGMREIKPVLQVGREKGEFRARPIEFNSFSMSATQLTVVMRTHKFMTATLPRSRDNQCRL